MELFDFFKIGISSPELAESGELALIPELPFAGQFSSVACPGIAVSRQPQDEGSIPAASTNPSPATWPPPIVARRVPPASLRHFHAANAVYFASGDNRRDQIRRTRSPRF